MLIQNPKLRASAIPSPIVLFVFARPDHTRQTLTALAANQIADQSDLFVYADAARNKAEVESVNEVRELVHSTVGFRSVTVIEREYNYGLARNIIEGVTEVCNRYGRVIVLEDDIVTSTHFLSFMNAALDHYANEPRVWHISGWNYPIDPGDLGDAFLWQMMNCWGWATWSNRWKHFNKEPNRLISAWNEERIKRFNLDGSYDFWAHIQANEIGQLNTWAIFWYATIFENNGLSLNPTRTYVLNIGHDGSGENSGKTNCFDSQINEINVAALPSNIEESKIARSRIKNYYFKLKPSLIERLFNKLYRLSKTS